MKILFVGLAAHYTEGMTYQDNMLAQQCIQDGYDVLYISDTKYYDDGELVKTTEKQEKLSDGLQLYRVDYDFIINKVISDKLRSCKKIYVILNQIKPDIIFLHGPNTLAIREVCRYLKENPQVRFYVDSHADYYTSGTTFFSRIILHGMIYRRGVWKCLEYTDKLLCVSVNCMRFAEGVYKIQKDRLEYYPLGGEIIDEKTLNKKRNLIRKKYKWADEDIVFLQAGKIDAAKCLVEALNEFIKFDNSNWIYVIIGSLDAKIAEELKVLQRYDSRITYLGWKTGEEVMDCLIGCDVYIQPGKVSALAQNAICMGSAVALRDNEDYRILINGNGWLLEKPEDSYKVFQDILEDNIDLKEFRKKSCEQARKILSYKKRAERLYIRR